ncbi:MAG: response regulator [OM182 bacterium]
MTLVNDLLDFSSRGPDGNQLKLESVGLHRMATLVIAICSPKIGEKPIKLRNTVDPELPLIEADKDRLQRILVNLTANAIEFTRSGEVDIGGEVIADSMIRIRVLDTGIGIHESEHEKIFRNVEKLPSRKQNAQGVGLGLPIAKHMIEMHLSKLSMTSALGVGSEFSFNLRMALDQSRASVASTFDEQMIMRAEFAQEALRREADPALRSQQNITVMIVDDDKINRIVIGQQLSEYTVINYANGMDALTAVAESKPDLILLDLMMPGLSGHEVCQKIRQRYNPIELPIILVTAKNHLENLAEALATGANDFLPKPFHKQELKSRVENQLKLSLMHRTSKENIRLRSLIKSYSEADRELRHSRMQLQQVLEKIDEGFIAFELPGHIFSFNKTTTDLLGTDRKTLEGAESASVFKKSLNSEKLLDALARWETEDLQSNSGDLVFSLQEKIQLAIPYGDANKLNAEMVTVDVRLMLFGNNEGTGVLFILTDKESSEEGCWSKKRYDAAELVGILGQAQQNVRRINARLSVLKPIELNQQPELLEELIRIYSLVEKITSNLPDMDSDSEYRQQLVTLMRSALHAWEVTTQKSKIELVEESNIWAVSIDDGRLRTRTFDRYLRLEQLPKVPRWREVVRTAYFVLSIPTIETEIRLGLEHELEESKALLKKAAIN